MDQLISNFTFTSKIYNSLNLILFYAQDNIIYDIVISERKILVLLQ